MKYGKKSSFSREKLCAYSETDIQCNENKLEKYKNVRSVERKHNIDVAHGRTAAEEDAAAEEDTEEDTEEDEIGYQFYYKKMNFIICNLPAFYSLDSLINEFATYGKIQYITYLSADKDGINRAKLVVDGWYNYEDVDVSFIIEVQNAIMSDGEYIWTSNDVGKMHIVRDTDQTLDELGEQIVVYKKRTKVPRCHVVGIE